MASATMLSSTNLKLYSNFICFSPSKPTLPNTIFPFTTHFKRNPLKLNASFNEISDDLLETTLHLDQFPIFKSGYAEFQRATEDLPENEKWGVLVFAGLVWIYLTARPGVLFGAIDTYLLAPAQKVFDSLSGRRNLKRSDFLIGDKLGEGSFGVVYSGVVVPKNFTVEERVRSSGSKRRQLEKDERFKEKVILKQVTIPTFLSKEFITFFLQILIQIRFCVIHQVKIGVAGAIECGEFEEWFNYRLSRAAPETCAEFLGSFVSDKTSSQFTKGEKWLVWKFEVNPNSEFR